MRVGADVDRLAVRDLDLLLLEQHRERREAPNETDPSLAETIGASEIGGHLRGDVIDAASLMRPAVDAGEKVAAVGVARRCMGLRTARGGRRPALTAGLAGLLAGDWATMGKPVRLCAPCAPC